MHKTEKEILLKMFFFKKLFITFILYEIEAVTKIKSSLNIKTRKLNIITRIKNLLPVVKN